jgi:precorrin-6Y C5,15-methyltransferase (decarboxylating)
MSLWLNIIGVGEGGVPALAPHLRELVTESFTVIGPFRFLASVAPAVTNDVEVHPELVQRRSLEAVARALLYVDDEDVTFVEEDLSRVMIEWQPPIENMIKQILPLRGSPTVILATGDPMWFGIGATLAKHLEPDEFAIHTHPAAFQLAAAKLHWPLQHVVTLSLHGRPIEAIHPHILPGNRILALTTDATTIDRVSDILANRGYGQSIVTALENLGGVEEKVTSSTAEDFDPKTVGDFYVLAVDCVADKDAALLPPVIGLPDEAFVSDGQLTKREVRAATLSKLLPFPGALLWDVGAGCGSVGIEWLRAARDGKAIAFERDEKRLEMIGDNARALGTPALEIVPGSAPDSLKDKPAPDAIFIGGDVASDELFDACWAALKPGGRLVANAVTLDGEAALIRRQELHGGDLTRIDIATLDTVGKHKVMRARLPVTQWSVQKP